MNPPVEHHLRVNRSARYYVVGTPSAATTDVWIVLHGYGQLAEPFARACAPTFADTRVIVAPEALSRFYLDEPFKRHGPDSPVGASWMTVQDRQSEITDYVGYLEQLAATVKGAATNAKLTVLGFSQGVAAACRFAALGSSRVDRMILWGGSLPNDLPQDRGNQLFRGASIVLVAGRADAIVPVKFMQKQLAGLAEAGIAAEFLEYDGGHSLNSETLLNLSSRA